ncbi:MAG: type II toxin-antitoxin system HicA family toxin [Alphaproteobacteria bacterium]|nr:type II toxin-antitoxin system HicA family toxin [Alphaproteobacteria bacterium]
MLRVSGSHHVYGKQGNPLRISVPMHGNATLKRGLQRHLIRIAGIPDDQDGQH